MKALSIRQPWAWLIVNGFKDIENRTWRTHKVGTILIHAAKKVDIVDWSQVKIMMGNGKEFERLLIERDREEYTGGIVGKADIVDCVDHYSSDWFFGPCGFVLKNQSVLPFYPCRGKLSFFEVDYPDNDLEKI